MTDSGAFAVEVDQDDGGATVIVTGDIDLATVRRLERAREQALAGSPSRLVIDLGGVRFIDSSGLKFLTDTLRLSRSDGWQLQLLRPQASAMRAFIVTGVDQHLPFLDGGG